MGKLISTILTLLFAAAAIIPETYGAGPDFDWGNATVYFVITDRFCNGDSTNDVNYGRRVDYGSEQLNAATFHGGDFKGMLQKARQGYFRDLGVDVVWMTDVYEQIHGWHPFSYLNNSYHRDADMDNMMDCATTLQLSPGAAQIFYGDETRRRLSDARFNEDSDQAFRSDMDWNDVDSELLEHFQRLGQIRCANPVIGTGRQRTLDTHTALRYNDWDSLLIRLRPEEGKSIDLYGAYADGDTLTELYTGQKAKVQNGRISFPVYRNHVAILKKQ